MRCYRHAVFCATITGQPSSRYIPQALPSQRWGLDVPGRRPSCHPGRRSCGLVRTWSGSYSGRRLDSSPLSPPSGYNVRSAKDRTVKERSGACMYTLKSDSVRYEVLHNIFRTKSQTNDVQWWVTVNFCSVWAFTHKNIFNKITVRTVEWKVIAQTWTGFTLTMKRPLATALCTCISEPLSSYTSADHNEQFRCAHSFWPRYRRRPASWTDGGEHQTMFPFGSGAISKGKLLPLNTSK